MPELMAWADVVVSAAGSTCWEVCLGMPAVLIDLADNQRPIAEALARKECAIHLGSTGQVSTEKIGSQLEWLLLSPAPRIAISHRARELVDTRGAIRVVSALRARNLHLRSSRTQAQALRVTGYDVVEGETAGGFGGHWLRWTSPRRHWILFLFKIMKRGEPFTAHNVRSIRPGHGMHKRHLPLVLGKPAACDIQSGTPLSWSLIGDQ